MSFDRTAIFLHDAGKGVLRLFILESSLPPSYFTVGVEMPQEESHVGWAFREQRYRVCRDLETERRYPMEERAFQDGVRSYVIVPLIVRERFGRLSDRSAVSVRGRFSSLMRSGVRVRHVPRLRSGRPEHSRRALHTAIDIMAWRGN